MNIKESYQPNNKPELGSYGVKKYGKPEFVKRDIKKDENWDDINEKNQKEYNESKEIINAINDLEISLTFTADELSENNKKALTEPLDFRRDIDSLINKDNIKETKKSLEEVLDELETLYSKIENSRIKVLNFQENYKNINDINLDNILNKRIEKALSNIDHLLFRIGEHIEYLKLKKEE